MSPISSVGSPGSLGLIGSNAPVASIKDLLDLLINPLHRSNLLDPLPKPSSDKQKSEKEQNFLRAFRVAVSGPDCDECHPVIKRAFKNVSDRAVSGSRLRHQAISLPSGQYNT